MLQEGAPARLGEEKRVFRCVIVDDHRLFAESLRFVLRQGFPHLDWVTACSAEEALRLAPQDGTKLFLVDVHLPDMNGVELTRRLLEVNPSLQVVILTMDNTLETAVQAIASGANGYLLKTAPVERVYKDLEAIFEGDLVISAELLPFLFTAIQRVHSPRQHALSPSLQCLSSRELEVLSKVVQGKSNQKIAQELFISEKTVKNHVAHILEKLGIPNRLQLIIFALQEGLLPEGNISGS